MDKTIYINGAISGTDNRELDIAQFIEEFTNYLISKNLMFGGSIDYQEIE